jgi:hypothetical protein
MLQTSLMLNMSNNDLQCTSQELPLTNQNTSITSDESQHAISTQNIPFASKAESNSRGIDEIVQRICREKVSSPTKQAKANYQIPYIGIYKPGELGRETWRAVVPSCTRIPGKSKGRRRGKGRGLKGQWESVVLSTPSRGGIDRLVGAVRHLAASIFTFTMIVLKLEFDLIE